MTVAVKVAVPGNQRDARPPVANHAAPSPGAATRPSTLRRPEITPELWDDGLAGMNPDSPYVRRFWTAVIGPTAVAELLRLTTAARRQVSVRRPLRLPQLVAEGLVALESDRVLVRATVPFLGPRQLQRLRPSLRAEHDATISRPST
jgi:hypothetical protein